MAFMKIDAAQTIIYLGAWQALQLCLVAFFGAGGERRGKGPLAGAMAALGLLLVLVAQRLGPRPLADYPYPLLHAWGTLALLVSPLLYLHVRQAIGGYRWQPRMLWHFAPALLHAALLLPLPLLAPEQRADLLRRYLELELYRSLLPGVRIGALQAVFYWSMSFVWVRRLERHIEQSVALTDREHMLWLKWLTSLLMGLLLVLALGRATAIGPMDQLVALGFSLFLLSVNTLVLLRPSLLHGFPALLRLPEPAGEEEPAAVECSEDERSEDERRGDEQLGEQLRAYFARERPYLREALTLVEVAAALRVARGQLSRVVNETQGKSFTEFVNDYRVEQAMALMRDPAQVHLSVDGIAQEVGFRSRSVFFAAFKKRTEQTPAAWRKLHGAAEQA